MTHFATSSKCCKTKPSPSLVLPFSHPSIRELHRTLFSAPHNQFLLPSHGTQSSVPLFASLRIFSSRFSFHNLHRFPAAVRKHTQHDSLDPNPKTFSFRLPHLFFHLLAVRSLLVRLPYDYLWLLNCGWL